jgi:hypothetical protein
VLEIHWSVAKTPTTFPGLWRRRSDRGAVARHAADPDTQPTIGFKAIMREAADTRSYAAVAIAFSYGNIDIHGRAPYSRPHI